jgi:hypothetical protein
MSLHLNNTKFTKKDIEEVKKKAMYIFANRKIMNEQNRQKLKEEHSRTNPIANLPVSTINNIMGEKHIKE